MSQIFDDFKKYRDQYGLNQLRSDGEKGYTEDNGALFTMEYLLCLLSNLYDAEGKIVPEIFKEVQDEIQRVRGVFTSLEEIFGFSVRNPGNPSTDSMDNVGALLAFSALWGDHAFAIRRRNIGLNIECDGVKEDDRSKKWSKWAKLWSTLQFASFFKEKNYWTSATPHIFDFDGWHGRSPGMMGWLDICATGHTSWFRALGLWVGQVMSIFAKPGDTDAWKLSAVIWYSLRHRGWTWKVGYAIWAHYLLKKYPEGMRGVYTAYYQDPNHPIRMYSKAYIG